MNNLIGSMRKTIQTYELIVPNDRIAVGLSGGKDSMALVYMLKKYQRFSPVPFALEAISIDLGFNNFKLDEAKAFCDQIEVPLTIVKTEIAQIVFDIRQEKNPCSLCATMRRGALADAMKERNLNKLALGHHQDDALATLLMNMLYAGKLNTLEYISHLTKKDIYVIRPFLDSSESAVKKAIKTHDIPVLKSPCPMDKKTKREEMEVLLKSLSQENPFARKNLIAAMRNEDHCNLFINKKVPLL